MTADRVAALRSAVELQPDNHALRALLAEALAADGQVGAALDAYRPLVDADALTPAELLRVGHLAVDHGDARTAGRCLDRARRAGAVDGLGELEGRVRDLLGAAERVPAEPAADPPAAGWVTETLTGGFSAVGGLDDVKQVVHRLIVLPLQRPDLYARYGRRAGGGVLLYGPPGCGKTLLARATAGECGLPFVNVRIEDVLDPWLGNSERNLHHAFAAARELAPCVLFLDELDGLAYARRKQQSGTARTLVDLLLQELDAIGSDNDGLLVLAATNAPWDVDDALLRPGRFDRRIFVPPPDQAARRAILAVHAGELPSDELDLDRVAASTPLFSGADLRALVDAAVDEVIDEALAGGAEPPVTTAHLLRHGAALRPTTLGWLERARNHVEFANAGERYADVAAYLATREVRRRLR